MVVDKTARAERGRAMIDGEQIKTRAGGANVFDTPEALELEAVLRGMAEPQNATAIRRALVTPILGQNTRALSDLQQDEKAWDRWVASFRAWREVWSKRGFIQAFWSLMVEQPVGSER